MRGVTFPEQIEVSGKKLGLNGLGLRIKTVFQVGVYVAALYLQEKNTSEDAILSSTALKQIDIVFLRDVEAKDIVNSWNEGFAANCQIGCDVYQKRLDQLNSAMVDVKKNQKVTFVFYPDHFDVSTPGHSPTRYDGKDFGDMVISTFIGKAPPTPEVKNGMLGKLAH